MESRLDSPDPASVRSGENPFFQTDVIGKVDFLCDIV